MILCIAEKPSVAKEIATVLGARTRRDGYFEGSGYWVSWTYGHLCELKEPSDYRSYWRAWSIVHLPIVPDRFGIKLKEDDGIQSQFAVLKDLVSRATEVVNCGDAGQEGELIQRWVLQLAECRVPVRRLWLSSMTTEAIREAFDNLRDAHEYNNLYYAGMARAIGDWLLGINATRLYTVKYGRGTTRRTLSIGRVQTPTLALIVDRYEQIQNFVPTPYQEIKTKYREVTFVSTKGRYDDIQEAQEVIAKLQGSELTITDLSKKKGKEAPPKLYDLTALQIEANKKFGYSADETLGIVQTLYERKLVTYPRVDTTYLSSDVYDKCPAILNGLYAFMPEHIKPLGHKKLPKPKRVFDDSKVTDHHAIIPTGEQPSPYISNGEDLIYKLIALRFVAAFYPDLEYEQTTVQSEAGGVKFRATGRTITKPGWKEVYSGASLVVIEPEEDKDEEKEESKRVLPDFVVGEHGPHEPSLLEKQTQPPKNYTEASLLNAMETAGKLVDDEELKEAMKQKGIGRPSTRAAIIQTLFQRSYIRKERKSLIPTPIGIELVHLIRNDMLKSVQLTGEWEYKLRLIDKGEYDAQTFVSELKEMVTKLIEDVVSDPRTMETLLDEAKIAIKASADSEEGKARKRTKKPRIKISKQEMLDSQAPSEQQIKAANETDQVGAEAHAMVEHAPTAPKVAEGDICPMCGEGTIIRGHTALGCSRYREGCAFRQPLT